jgi:hypothetical protein
MSDRKYSRETLEKRKAKRLSKTTETSFEEALHIISNENTPLDELREEYKEYLSNKKSKKKRPSKKPRRNSKEPVKDEEEQSGEDSGGVSVLLNKELLDFREKFKESLKVPHDKSDEQKPRNSEVLERSVVLDHLNQEPIQNSYHSPYSSYNEPEPVKNAAPSSQKIKSEEWFLLSQLEPDIMKLTLQILYEETIKFESGSASYSSIEYSVCLAMDRITSVRKDLEKQKEVEEQDEINVVKQEKILEKGYDSETETEEDKKIRYRKERLKWIEKMHPKIEDKETGNSTTISVPK